MASKKTDPSDLPTADFHDERNALGHWHSRLADLDVPTPRTEFVPYEEGDGLPEYSMDDVRSVVDSLGGRAHIRGHFASSRLMSEHGSHLTSDMTNQQIQVEILELLTQQRQMRMPDGKQIVIREWINLNWCNYAFETLHPECRVFVEDGEVLCHHPRLEGFEPASCGDEYRESAVQTIDRYWGDVLKPYAEEIAAEFEGSWSVDFVCTPQMDWYCTDMALRALYERDGELHGMSEHPGDCEHDLEAMIE